VPGYEVLGELGRGGMGVVYQARQVGLDRVVALKMLLEGSHAGPDDLARFRREAEVIARLRHPNVVQIYQVGEYQGLPFFSLEYCAGGSLARQIDGRPQPVQKAAGLVATLARGVQAAHDAGVVHRDLKPGNVLLDADGTPKITDFGLAKKLDGATGLTQTGVLLGTPSYMAPEQASGAKDVGPAADVWALGAILYELLTGRPPFRAATMMDTLMQIVSDAPVPPSRLRPGVPAELEAVCLRCLEKDPGRRPVSAAALAEELERFLAGTLRRPDRPQAWRRRFVRPLVTAAIVMLLPGLVALACARFVPERSPRATFPAAPVACLAPDGDRLVAARESAAVLCDTRNGRELRAFATPAGCTAAAFSPDGHRLALGGGGEVELWDLETGEVCGRFQVPGGAVRRLAFAADSAGFVAGTGEAGAPADEVRAVRWWDVKAARGGPAVAAAGLLAPDGRTLAERTADGLRLWDTAAGKVRGTLPVADEKDLVLAFSPDGRTLASTVRNRARSTRLWDTGTGKERASLQGRPGQVYRLLFSPDSRSLLTSASDRILWSVETGGQQTSPQSGHHEAVALTPDRRSLVAEEDQGVGRRGSNRVSRIDLLLLDLETGQEQARVGGDPASWYGYRFAALSADGRTLLTRDCLGSKRSPAEERLRVWDAAPFWRGFRPLAWLRTIGLLGIALGIIILIPVPLGIAVSKWKSAARPGTRPRALAFRPDGGALAVGCADGSLRLHDLGTAEVRLLARAGSKAAPKPAACALVFATKDGRPSLAVLDAAGVLKWWDLTSGDEPAASLTAVGRMERVSAAAFSPCGRWLAAAVGLWSLRQALRVWDLVEGKELATPPGVRAFVRGMSFAPDGGSLTADTSAGTKRWTIDRARDRVEECTVPAPVAPGTASPDGRTLAAVNADGTASLRAAATGEELAVLAVEEPPTVTVGPAGVRRPARGDRSVVLVAFALNGRTLALADDQGGVSWCDVALALSSRLPGR
jgi:WD40 repeat protein